MDDLNLMDSAFVVTLLSRTLSMQRDLTRRLSAASEREHGVAPMTLPITTDEILSVPGTVQAATLVKWRCSSLA